MGEGRINSGPGRYGVEQIRGRSPARPMLIGTFKQRFPFVCHWSPKNMFKLSPL